MLIFNLENKCVANLFDQSLNFNSVIQKIGSYSAQQMMSRAFNVKSSQNLPTKVNKSIYVYDLFSNGLKATLHDNTIETVFSSYIKVRTQPFFEKEKVDWSFTFEKPGFEDPILNDVSDPSLIVLVGLENIYPKWKPNSKKVQASCWVFWWPLLAKHLSGYLDNKSETSLSLDGIHYLEVKWIEKNFPKRQHAFTARPEFELRPCSNN